MGRQKPWTIRRNVDKWQLYVRKNDDWVPMQNQAKKEYRDIESISASDKGNNVVVSQRVDEF